MTPRRATLFVVALWAVGVAGGLAARPAWPIDETRYLAVAWEMWSGGDLLVPHLNGNPYSDKPPLLFWLVAAGWRLFGVSEWWARLVPSLFALGNLLLTARLARRLWPDREDVAHAAPPLLLATFFWSFFSTVFLFDMLLVFFALVAVSGAVAAARGDGRGWIAVSLGIALGILAKGPAILIPVLPVVLAGPAWWRGVRAARWYPRAVAAVLAGLALALAWALPAARSGGPAYSNAILLSQTAGRLTRSFAHARPLWWYVPFLPLLAFPWILWLPVWRRSGRAPARDPGLRLCAIWAGVVLLVFSLVSGKQIYYLLSLMPPVALLAARLLPVPETSPRRRDLALVAVAFLLLAAVLAGAPALADPLRLPGWIASLPPLAGFLPLAGAVALFFPAPRTRAAALERIAAASVLTLLAVLWGVGRAAAGSYDVSRIAGYLSKLESQGHPVAHAGRYHGEYQFAGRLRRPLEVIEPPEVDAWLSRHPDGYVVVYANRLVPRPWDELRHDFRGGTVAVRHASPTGSTPLKSPGDGGQKP
ncbi:MAG: glycosyltransferase family 39 protein [Acidobacteriota bacterium]